MKHCKRHVGPCNSCHFVKALILPNFCSLNTSMLAAALQACPGAQDGERMQDLPDEVALPSGAHAGLWAAAGTGGGGAIHVFRYGGGEGMSTAGEGVHCMIQIVSSHQHAHSMI